MQHIWTILDITLYLLNIFGCLGNIIINQSQFQINFLLLVILDWNFSKCLDLLSLFFKKSIVSHVLALKTKNYCVCHWRELKKVLYLYILTNHVHIYYTTQNADMERDISDRSSTLECCTQVTHAGFHHQDCLHR